LFFRLTSHFYFYRRFHPLPVVIHPCLSVVIHVACQSFIQFVVSSVVLAAIAALGGGTYVFREIKGCTVALGISFKYLGSTPLQAD